jgi:hypothetical protein
VEVLTRRVDWMRCDTRIIVGRAVQLRGGGDLPWLRVWRGRG